MRDTWEGTLQRDTNGGLDVAANIEIALDRERTGSEPLFKGIENGIRHRFVRYTLIAEAVEVEFQALEFHDFFIRRVNNPDRRKIGIP